MSQQMTNSAAYMKWFSDHGLAPVLLRDMVSIEMEDGDVQFVLGGIRGILPYVRGYFNAKSDGPRWHPETWWPLHEPSQAANDEKADGPRDPEAKKDGIGWIRFLRADQALDMLASMHPPKSDPVGFRLQVARTLKAWFVPIDWPLVSCHGLLARRVETVRICERVDWQQRRWWHWSRWLRGFPNALRRDVVKGLDAVHTPENARAGLTRYLCEGWTIGDDGSLVAEDGASNWDACSAANPFRARNTPRRLMIGDSLQSHSVWLQVEDEPVGWDDLGAWCPRGRNLLALFSAFGGWTHEDAIVISESASDKLKSMRTRRVDLLIPSVANRIVPAEPGALKRGAPLVRASVDLYAMGYRKHEAENLGAIDGWVEIAIPGAELANDSELVAVERQPTATSSRWRELITCHLEDCASVGVGDKLATPHGIKGVVSRILPDGEMPALHDKQAEIILSPTGIARRGAMGQFCEAAGKAKGRSLPRSGTIFVMRQPQDAGHRDRYRWLGSKWEPGKPKGQRYGEMEFWALMAHGADDIARELLSLDRSTARWMEAESRIGVTNSGRIATRALNRYLAILGAHIENGQLVGPNQGGQLVVERQPASFEIKVPKIGHIEEVLKDLDDENWFGLYGGLGAIILPEPVSVSFWFGSEKKRREFSVLFKALHVIPPWLRPKVRGFEHKLTAAYKNLLKALTWKTDHGHLETLVRKCVRIAMGEVVNREKQPGVDVFLRREVLGRRLTRSARAVIVPDPSLHIDQIGLPEQVAEVIFRGLSEPQQSVVLVNRNPTLQRRGLLALRPVIDKLNAPVFRLPLGVLRALAADFDGDQATVVALETDEAVAQAERLLLPGCEGLRCDPFRPSEPAFPLLKEMATPERERALANNHECSQKEWCAKHAELIRERVDEIGDGWLPPMSKPDYSEALGSLIDVEPDPVKRRELEILRGLWEGLSESEWLALAAQKDQMEIVYASVRKKGRYGGVLRRQLYRRRFTDPESFRFAVEALHAVTEPLVQSALSCKSGKGAFSFPVDVFFEDPSAQRSALKMIDPVKDNKGESVSSRFDEDVLCKALGPSPEAIGLLAWFAKPTFQTLLEVITQEPTTANSDDPRISWYLE